MNFLAQIITWINIATNAMGKVLFAPIAVMPGWLSNTIISAITGVILLIIFKYTSNQSAIGRVRDQIKANMLALKLFKDSILVTFQSQGRVFKGALLLLLHAIRPMLVMIVPVSLLLAQLGLWYQSRPLQQQEQTIITMKLNGTVDPPLPNVSIESIPGAEVTLGPVQIPSKRQICWKIKALKNGYHRIIFEVNQQQIEKELAVGDGLMRVSVERPSWQWGDILWYPFEKPFTPDSLVQSISIHYPTTRRIIGIPLWGIYFFFASMLFALIFKPFLKVRI